LLLTRAFQGAYKFFDYCVHSVFRFHFYFPAISKVLPAILVLALLPVLLPVLLPIYLGLAEIH
jgi:hypothetical protein